MRFVFDGTFWEWSDIIPQSVSPTFVSPTSAQTPFPTSLPSPSMLAVTHAGAVHEFLLLHFRLGHLNYNAMLRALQSGSWTGFRHSVKKISSVSIATVPGMS